MRKKDKIKNLKCIMCISFNKVRPVQLIYHESRYTEVKSLDVTHPTDMNFDPTYSAVMKIISSLRSQTTTLLTHKYKFIEFTIGL